MTILHIVEMKFIVFLFIVMALASDTEAKRAGELARHCVLIQQEIAVQVARDLKTDKVYVYDAQGFFDNAENRTTESCIRYKEKGGKYAVLSGSAQAVLKNTNEYQQFSRERNPEDAIGVYVFVSATRN